MENPHRPSTNPSGINTDQTRIALLTAAQHEFAERGFHAASLRTITDRAGVAHGMIRHHFGTKLSIWHAVVDHAVHRYRTALEPYAAQDVSRPEDVLSTARAAGRGFLEISARHPEVLRLMVHESTGGQRLDYLLDQLAPVETMMAPLFAHLQQAGRLSQFHQPSFFLALLTAGAMPFALPALSAGILKTPLLPDTEEEHRHITRILDTLYGPEVPV